MESTNASNQRPILVQPPDMPQANQVNVRYGQVQLPATLQQINQQLLVNFRSLGEQLITFSTEQLPIAPLTIAPCGIPGRTDAIELQLHIPAQLMANPEKCKDLHGALVSYIGQACPNTILGQFFNQVAQANVGNGTMRVQVNAANQKALDTTLASVMHLAKLLQKVDGNLDRLAEILRNPQIANCLLATIAGPNAPFNIVGSPGKLLACSTHYPVQSVKEQAQLLFDAGHRDLALMALTAVLTRRVHERAGHWVNYNEKAAAQKAEVITQFVTHLTANQAVVSDGDIAVAVHLLGNMLRELKSPAERLAALEPCVILIVSLLEQGEVSNRAVESLATLVDALAAPGAIADQDGLLRAFTEIVNALVRSRTVGVAQAASILKVIIGTLAGAQRAATVTTCLEYLWIQLNVVIDNESSDSAQMCEAAVDLLQAMYPDGFAQVPKDQCQLCLQVLGRLVPFALLPDNKELADWLTNAVTDLPDTEGKQKIIDQLDEGRIEVRVGAVGNLEDKGAPRRILKKDGFEFFVHRSTDSIRLVPANGKSFVADQHAGVMIWYAEKLIVENLDGYHLAHSWMPVISFLMEHFDELNVSDKKRLLELVPTAIAGIETILNEAPGKHWAGVAQAAILEMASFFEASMLQSVADLAATLDPKSVLHIVSWVEQNQLTLFAHLSANAFRAELRQVREKAKLSETDQLPPENINNALLLSVLTPAVQQYSKLLKLAKTAGMPQVADSLSMYLEALAPLLAGLDDCSTLLSAVQVKAPVTSVQLEMAHGIIRAVRRAMQNELHDKRVTTARAIEVQVEVIDFIEAAAAESEEAHTWAILLLDQIGSDSVTLLLTEVNPNASAWTTWAAVGAHVGHELEGPEECLRNLAKVVASGKQPDERSDRLFAVAIDYLVLNAGPAPDGKLVGTRYKFALHALDMWLSFGAHARQRQLPCETKTLITLFDGLLAAVFANEDCGIELEAVERLLSQLMIQVANQDEHWAKSMLESILAKATQHPLLALALCTTMAEFYLNRGNIEEFGQVFAKALMCMPQMDSPLYPAAETLVESLMRLHDGH